MRTTRKCTDEQIKNCYLNKDLPNAVAADILGMSYNAYIHEVNRMVRRGEVPHVNHRKRTKEERARTPNITFPARKTAQADPMAADAVKTACGEFKAAADVAATAGPATPAADAVEKAGNKFLSAIMAALHLK